MRQFTIKKYDGKYNDGFYALKKGGEVLVQIEDKEDEVVLHAVDKKVRFNRREGQHGRSRH